MKISLISLKNSLANLSEKTQNGCNKTNSRYHIRTNSMCSKSCNNTKYQLNITKKDLTGVKRMQL